MTRKSGTFIEAVTVTGSSHLLIWLVMIKCQFLLVVNDSTFVYTGYEFYLLYGSLLTLKSDKDSKYTFDINYDSFTIHKTKFF